MPRQCDPHRSSETRVEDAASPHSESRIGADTQYHSVEITIHLEVRIEEGGTLRKIHVPDGVERFTRSVSPEERTAANASRV